MSGGSQTHLSARLDGGPLVFASHNAGKIREIRALVAPFDIKIVSAADLDLPEPDETRASFADNAILKAEAAVNATGHAALSDDSGLAVAALGGEPGIHSARWAGPDGDFTRAMRNVEEKLQAAGANTAPDRGAAFVCVLALVFPGGEPELFEGRIKGTLVWPPRGDKGFGYDPMFLPEGKTQTFGEMEAADKHGWARAGEAGLSHRARAFARFAQKCLTSDG